MPRPKQVNVRTRLKGETDEQYRYRLLPEGAKRTEIAIRAVRASGVRFGSKAFWAQVQAHPAVQPVQ